MQANELNFIAGDFEIIISENPPTKLVGYFAGYDFHSPALFGLCLYPYMNFPTLQGGSFILSKDKKYLALEISCYRPSWAHKILVFNFEDLTYCCVELLCIKYIISFDFPFLTYHCYKEQEVITRSVKYQVWHSFKDYKNKRMEW